MVGKVRSLLSWIRRTFWTVELFAIYNVSAILIGGALASYTMRPDLEAGPVRSTVYFIFGVAALVLAIKYLWIILKDEEKLASLFVVASFYWWLSFSVTGFFVEYLILARAYGLWPSWGEALQERVSYFFIGGAAVGLTFKAVSFMFVPTEQMIGRKVAAWPITAVYRWRSRGRSDAGDP